MRILYPLCFVLCFLLSKTSFSQQRHPQSKTDVVEFSKTYYYTFQGEASPDALESLRQDLLNIIYVQDAKIEYKAERKAGQVRLVTREKAVTQEGDKEFSMVYIKQALIAHGFSPVDFRSEDTPQH